MSSTRDVIEFATAHHGVFTVSEAAALGMGEKVVANRVANGIFVRIGRGILALPGTATRPDLIMRAAHRLLHGVVSHESAGRTHGLEPITMTPPTLTVSHRSTNRFPGVIVHQSTDLLESHLMVIDGLRTTTPARTIIDLSQTTTARRLERIVDNALSWRTVGIDELVDLHLALARRGKPGTIRLRRVLGERTGQSPVSPSVLERRLISLLREAGLPQPVSEFQAPWLRPVDGRVDLAYQAERVVIEADSRRWHTLFDAFEVDRRRDNAAQLAGWIVLRFTWRMISEEPARVVAAVREALAHRSQTHQEAIAGDS